MKALTNALCVRAETVRVQLQVLHQQRFDKLWDILASFLHASKMFFETLSSSMQLVRERERESHRERLG